MDANNSQTLWTYNLYVKTEEKAQEIVILGKSTNGRESMVFGQTLLTSPT